MNPRRFLRIANTEAVGKGPKSSRLLFSIERVKCCDFAQGVACGGAAMTNQELMRDKEGKFFEFKFSDGEKTVGKLLFVDLETGQFIYEMSATNEPTRYQNRLGQYQASFAELEDVELLDRD